MTIKAPKANGLRGWGCPTQPIRARLVRQFTPIGHARVIATHQGAPVFLPSLFTSLNQHHWRIKEAFDWIKLRSRLEAISGLSQQARVIDEAAKISSDNNHPVVAHCGCHAG